LSSGSPLATYASISAAPSGSMYTWLTAASDRSRPVAASITATPVIT
jgi:hypothetical protein